MYLLYTTETVSDEEKKVDFKRSINSINQVIFLYRLFLHSAEMFTLIFLT